MASFEPLTAKAPPPSLAGPPRGGRSPSPAAGARAAPGRTRPASPASRAAPRALAGEEPSFGDPASAQASTKLRVVCRVRPLSEQEKRAGTVPAITASTERAEVVTMRGFQGRTNRSAFRFDHVLTSFSTQPDVFAVSLKPLVPDVLAGYEAAVFAYGQTGTGKTYTMEGDLDSADQRGLAPRAAEALIQALARGDYVRTSVTASCLEIYNEELTDLLAGGDRSPQDQKLELRETGRGVCCTGLTEHLVSTVAEIQELMRRAQERRSVRETRANACSSRSHCLFTFKVCCRQAVADGEVETVGKLHLVDLAGSECARKADERAFASGSDIATAKGERERRNINQSLLTLGRVIAALRDESSRVPYRDSKLTRLLQEALGGGCKTVMIATISPAESGIDETISTLQYAEQASGIQNRPTAAAVHHFGRAPSGSPTGDRALGGAAFGDLGAPQPEGEACAELQTLQMRVEYLTQEVEEAQAAFERKRREVQSLHDRAEMAEEQRRAAAAELAEAQRRLAERSYALARTAQFADGQSAAARRLAEALEATRGRCAGLAGKVRAQGARAAGSRGQARRLCAALQGRVGGALAASEASAREAAEAAEEARRAGRRAAGAAACASARQRDAVQGLAHAARGGCDDLRACISDAVAAAVKTVATEGQICAAGLDAAHSAAAAAAGELRGGCESLAAVAELRGAELSERARSLHGALGAEANVLAEGADGLAAGIQAALETAQAGQEERRAAEAAEVRAPLASLADRLAAHSAGARQLSDVAKAAAQEAATGAARSASRIGRVQAAAADLAEGRAGVHANVVGPVESLVREMDAAASGRCGDLAGTLAAVAAELEAARTAAADSSSRGKAELDEALLRAEGAFRAAWAAAERELSALKEVLAQSADAHRKERGAAADEAAGCLQARDALEAAMRKEAAALAEERAAVAREIEALRRQKDLEQEALGALASQREALSADVERIQASLAESASAARSARASLAEAEEQQGRQREQAVGRVVAGLSALLQAELGGLGESLREGAAPACARLDEIASLSTSAAAAASAAERAAAEAGTQVGALASQLAAAGSAACDGIAASQRRAEAAARGAEAAAGAAAGRLGAAGGAAGGWSTKRGEDAAELDLAAGSIQGALDSQRALQRHWADARAGARGAAEAWAEGCAAAAAGAAAAAQRTGAAAEAAACLRQEMGDLHDAAQRRVTDWTAQEEQHRAALGELAARGLEALSEEEAAGAARQQSLAALAAAAAAAAGAAESAAEGASSLAAAAEDAASARARSMEAHWSSLSDSISAAQGLREAARHGGARTAAGLEELRREQAAVAHDAQQGALELAQRAAAAAAASAQATDRQRGSLAQAAKAATERWEALRGAPAAALGALEAAAAAAEEASAATAEAGMAEAAHCEEQADAAFARHRQALEAQAAPLSELSRLPASCREVLSAAPLAAFQEEGILEDEAAEIGEAPAEEAVPSLASLEALARPTEQELAAEFRACGGEHRMFEAIGPLGAAAPQETGRQTLALPPQKPAAQQAQRPPLSARDSRRSPGLQPSRVPSSGSLGDVQKPAASPREGAAAAERAAAAKRPSAGAAGAGHGRPALREVQTGSAPFGGA